MIQLQCAGCLCAVLAACLSHITNATCCLAQQQPQLLIMAQQQPSIRSCKTQGARHTITPWQRVPEVLASRLENSLPHCTESLLGEQPGGQEIRHTTEHTHYGVSFKQLEDGDDRLSWRFSGSHSAVAQGDQEQAHANMQSQSTRSCLD